MATRKIIIAVGALALIGGAAAIAQTGDRGGQGSGMGMGMGGRGFAGEGEHDHRGHHRGWRHGRGDGEGRGWRRGRDLTLDDIETRARQRFAQFDKNGDNVIDSSEIEARFNARRSGRGEGRGPGRGMMGGLDRDGDGKVARSEFDDVLKQRFARFDLNNDGRITDADLPPMMRGRNVLAGGGEMGRGRGGRGMLRGLRGADANKDGVVTFEEFAARANDRFATMDRNKDGVVDQADRDGLRSEMTAYRVARFIHRFGPEADKAKSVTRDQFLAAARERFTRRDVNKDGVVNRDDRGGGRREGRGPGGGQR